MRTLLVFLSLLGLLFCGGKSGSTEPALTSDSGQAVNPAGGKVAGSFFNLQDEYGDCSYISHLCLDAKRQRAYFLTRRGYDSDGRIHIFDLSSYEKVDTITCPGIEDGVPTHIIRTPSGMALGGGGHPIVLVSSPLIPAN